ncbi:hypothetical protein DM02DRAFT_664172 [Periconia macrospinosa]|uniref:Mid2 domain-containing protein n=1 Tax=Periconia macrospinosa TaxID=97972 RepID=A0A2V1CZU6_9PLEO|nr:hypothetical protein DM02DRAFT_664172 [Periconia macrospinosa]
MKTTNFVPLLTYFASLYTTIHAQSCYYANGTTVERKEFIPCSNDPVRTICCALNRLNPSGSDISKGWPRDTCLDNGVCSNNQMNNGQNVTIYTAVFCTNKDITSPDCLDVCRQTRGGGGGARMTPCDGTPTSKKWCCGDSSSCCTNNIGVVELPDKFVGRAIFSSASASSSSSTPASSPSASTSPPSTLNTTGQSQPASSAPPPPPTSATGLSIGAKAGIAIGAILGVLLLLGILFFVRKALAWKNKAASAASEVEVEASGCANHDSPHYQFQQQQDAVMYRYEAARNGINELSDAKAAKVSELPEAMQMAELPSYSPLEEKKAQGCVGEGGMRGIW